MFRFCNAISLKGTLRPVQGFTLVEGLVSTMIVGIALVSIFAGITASFDRVRAARQSFRATQIMLEKMEAIRIMTWEQLNSNGFVPRTFTAPYVTGTTNGLGFSGTCAIISATNVNAAYAADLRQINLTLKANWGTRRTWNMSSYYGRNGMQTYIAPH